MPESPERDPDGPSVVEVLQTLQASIDGQFTKVNSTLGDISERLQALESQQKKMEDKIEMRSAIQSPQPSSSDSGAPRKRRTPVSLQNPTPPPPPPPHSRITSAHNIRVVQQIIADIGVDEFSRDLIRGKQEIPLLFTF